MGRDVCEKSICSNGILCPFRIMCPEEKEVMIFWREGKKNSPDQHQ
jgi:hypothetical protein